MTRGEYGKRHFWLFVSFIFCAGIAASSSPASIDPNSFRTDAKFSVDDNAMALSTAIATIEPRLGAPGYSWLRISFYSFPVAADDFAGVVKGDTTSMDRKRSKKASNPKDYNSSYALIQLSVDQSSKVWQVDMSVPGHGCTIAPFEQDVKTFLQEYHFDGRRLRLKSKGSYVCDMKFMGVPNQRFGWDIDLDTTVFQKAK